MQHEKGDIQWNRGCVELLVHFQQGSSHLAHLPHFPVSLHCFMLILLLFFSAGKELREDNKDYQQVLLDVRRSLRRFPPGEGEILLFPL